MSETKSAAAAPIPMVDLLAEHSVLQPALNDAVLRVIASGSYILGTEVSALEREIAQMVGTRHAVACASGTDALHLALRAAGIGPGDEVITASFTFIGTAEAISYVGATPVFADIEPGTFNLDPASVERLIGPRTCALVPVHLFGQAAECAALAQLCERHGLKMIEDCAQSLGGDWDGRMTGAWGAAGCFSFYPTKNLGAYGDGGILTTDDDVLADTCRVLRSHGSRVRYHHEVLGYNSRLDEIQAAILRVKLPHLDRFSALRAEHAARYRERLEQHSALVMPVEHGNGRHAWHQFTLRLPDSATRDSVIKALAAEKIASMIYYPIPVHRQKVYEHLPAASLPETDRAAEQVLSLPMHPMLSDAQVDRICDVVLRVLRSVGVGRYIR